MKITRTLLLRGWHRQCPACGRAPVLQGYLKPVPRCTACLTDLSHISADDGPAWATIILVGHIIAPPLTATELAWNPPMWFSITFWPAAALALTAWLLPRIKGVFIAILWATGADQPDDGISAEDFG